MGAGSTSGALLVVSPDGVENYGTINTQGGTGSNSGGIEIKVAGVVTNNGEINLDDAPGFGIQSGRIFIDSGRTLFNNGIIDNESLIMIGGTLFNACSGLIGGTGAIVDAFGNPTDIDQEEPCNTDPDCSGAIASTSTLYQDDTIWPPNHKMEAVFVQGVTDPDNDPVTITVDSIFQDELTNGLGDGDQSPDGDGVGTDTAQVRAERSGVDNGRVYHIGFTAEDDTDGMCSGVIFVQVPHDKKSTAIDDGPLYDSTSP